MVFEALNKATGIVGGNEVDNIVNMLKTGIFDQIVHILPVVIPVIIGFIAFRKGYKFLKTSLRSA